MFTKHDHIFTHLLDAIECQALMEKLNAPFLILVWKVKRIHDLTKTFTKLGNMPESINSDEKNTLEFLVKIVYFGNVKDIENINLNEMRKHQFLQSISNDLKNIAPRSNALNMHSFRSSSKECKMKGRTYGWHRVRQRRVREFVIIRWFPLEKRCDKELKI